MSKSRKLPISITNVIPKFSERLPNEVISEEEFKRRTAEQVEASLRSQRKKLWSSIRLGASYRGCRLDSFRVSNDPVEARQQKLVLSGLRGYVAKMPAMREAGRNVLLYGPSRTGKDHLLVELMHAACRECFSVLRIKGSQLFRAYRDVIGKNASEVEFVESFASPDVLVLSDPVVNDKLSDGQYMLLYEILDERLERCLPTWITVNFVDGDDAESKIGTRLLERMKQNALMLHCNWKPFRFS